ncbi:Thermonuclease precursor [Mycoplasmopsis maculosa]|uniref:Thermonuclease n=1 Tax=Mycoplasmopsis maculosa TaxID=114885 RepID=A0A449B4I0_9BACT|nr:thermonuclease family protein [Mycoplasmopsis maculosa]VEU75507.1 Thermonuclease precursor [Mycoplasmopsis maculosa]
MKKQICGLIILMSFFITSCSFNNAPSFGNKIKIENNIKIIDGDTISFNTNEDRNVIRIFGIDAPEIFKTWKDNAKYENYYAQKAAAFIKEIWNKSEEFYYIPLKKDKYNRIVSKLFYRYFGKEYDIGYELVKEGLARVKYIDIVNKKSEYFTNAEENVNYFYLLKKIENLAKISKKNIWSKSLNEVFHKK